jgi:hypothetical protein
MAQEAPTKLTRAQRFELAKLSMQLELEARKAARARFAAHRNRSILAWMRHYIGPLTLLSGLLSAGIGGLFNYATREPPRDPPAVVQPLEPRGDTNWKTNKPVIPKDKPEEPMKAPTFQLIGHEMPERPLPKPVQRAVNNAGIIFSTGNEEAASESLKKFLQTAGYATDKDTIVMTSWDTFKLTPKPAAPTITTPRGFELPGTNENATNVDKRV